MIELPQQRDRVGVVRPALQAKRSLADGRQHPGGVEDVRDRRAQAQPLQARLSQDQGVEAVLVELAQTGLDVAANVEEAQVRPTMPQLRTSPQAAGCHRCAGRQVVHAAVAA
jgi:hypothetical protein